MTTASLSATRSSASSRTREAWRSADSSSATCERDGQAVTARRGKPDAIATSSLVKARRRTSTAPRLGPVPVGALLGPGSRRAVALRRPLQPLRRPVLGDQRVLRLAPASVEDRQWVSTSPTRLVGARSRCPPEPAPAPLGRGRPLPLRLRIPRHRGPPLLRAPLRPRHLRRVSLPQPCQLRVVAAGSIERGSHSRGDSRAHPIATTQTGLNQGHSAAPGPLARHGRLGVSHLPRHRLHLRPRRRHRRVALRLGLRDPRLGRRT